MLEMGVGFLMLPYYGPDEKCSTGSMSGGSPGTLIVGHIGRSFRDMACHSELMAATVLWLALYTGHCCEHVLLMDRAHMR